MPVVRLRPPPKVEVALPLTYKVVVVAFVVVAFTMVRLVMVEVAALIKRPSVAVRGVR